MTLANVLIYFLLFNYNIIHANTQETSYYYTDGDGKLKDQMKIFLSYLIN